MRIDLGHALPQPLLDNSEHLKRYQRVARQCTAAGSADLLRRAAARRAAARRAATRCGGCCRPHRHRRIGATRRAAVAAVNVAARRARLRVAARVGAG